MTFDFDSYYAGLFTRTNYFDNYLDIYPNPGEKRNKAKIIPLLAKNINEKDSISLACTLGVAYLDGADKDYTDLLLSVLNADWHILIEDIIEVLELTKDPKAVDSLYEAALDFRDYDDFRSIGKKSIWALITINTPEAWEKLSLLAQVDDEIIKENANLSLRNRKK
ncbi:type 2 periplasmic-binding domain-containing protein [Pedobacter caeni]|uniref:HEAT repeat-containing protein n=1 Tax=Pedobacter caeni TaxID=288992 RepID=A0A1M5HIX5_9SPHI|nr:hypothetical protein [Pedobacter caeni]SHG15848.1 hypothetical protein SAMN04488522_104681 [Pedobacter caeni]